MIFFTSDLHFDHAGIIKMCNRPFNDVKEMNDYLIDKINSLVKTEDKLYHLGDLSWTHPEPFIKRINCRDITFIKGNHDKDSWHLEEYGEYRTQLYLKSHNIFLNHFPHAYWPCSHYGSNHLYGHCVDIKTEILTNNGWKNYITISENDKVYSFKSLESTDLIIGSINRVIINKNMTDDVYLYETGMISICVSKDHSMIDNNKYTKAEEFFNKSYSPRKKIPLCGSIKNSGIQLSDDLIRLYIYIAADGSYNKKTNLARFAVKKERKIENMERLLTRLNINFTKNKRVRDTCFNFKLPEELSTFNIKGLDWKLLNCSESQVDIIVQSYVETDGYLCGGKYPVIFTSKDQEKDILQAITSINNYKSTVYSRIHGFGKKVSHAITLTKNRKTCGVSREHLKVCKPESSITWCVETEHGNFLARRNGKVFITGNCHAEKEQELDNIWPERRSMDVGVDNAKRLLGDYIPFSLDDIIRILGTRKGHHQIGA